jgi:hypothetical protein
VLGENGGEYITKGPSLNPERPYVAANEPIAARVAESLGLPLLDYRLLYLDDDLFFGSSWMPPESFHPTITKELFDRCENRDRSYDLVVFDVWIGNTDRHANNLMVRKLGRVAREDRLLLTLIDHSHALIPDGRKLDELEQKIGDVPPIRLDFVRESIRSRSVLADAVGQVQDMTNARISAIVSSVPAEFLSAEDGERVEQFLVHRRDRLHELIASASLTFPRLHPGGTPTTGSLIEAA